MITRDDLQGHWRRDWIKAPGFEDQTTRVHWLQAGDLYADIRVPLMRPNLSGASCLADLSAADLAVLMQAEGFAGTITVENDHCTWRRDINWHGVPEQDDIGLMWFDAPALIEDGVLATYRERWLAEPSGPLTAQRITCAGQTGVLVSGEAVFLLALGPMPQGTSSDAIKVLERGHVNAAVRQYFNSLYCLGHWQGDTGIADLATNPFCEGLPVLSRSDGITLNAPGFDGVVTTTPLTTG